MIEERPEWIVVNKPPGLQVHPKKPGGPRTLWDELRGLLAYELVNGGSLSIINRLDRETSGVVLIAKTTAAARRFHRAMQARAFAKEYLALVRGWPEWESHGVDAPILRQGEVRPSAVYLRRTVHPKGAAAFTRFRVEARLEHPRLARFALVRAFPATGRTHQIRVHLAHAGHPILGDKLYGPDPGCYLEFIRTGWTPALEARLFMARHALHSARLGAEVEGICHDWRAEDVPDDFATWIAGAGAAPGDGLRAPWCQTSPAAPE